MKYQSLLCLLIFFCAVAPAGATAPDWDTSSGLKLLRKSEYMPSEIQWYAFLYSLGLTTPTQFNLSESIAIHDSETGSRLYQQHPSPLWRTNLFRIHPAPFAYQNPWSQPWWPMSTLGPFDGTETAHVVISSHGGWRPATYKLLCCRLLDGQIPRSELLKRFSIREAALAGRREWHLENNSGITLFKQQLPRLYAAVSY